MSQTWSQLFAMGGYARYVWSAYGIAAVVLIANIVVPVIAHRRIKRRIRDEAYMTRSDDDWSASGEPRS